MGLGEDIVQRPVEIRGQLLHYIRGFRGAAELRGRAVRVDCSGDLEDILTELEEMLIAERQRNS